MVGDRAYLVSRETWYRVRVPTARARRPAGRHRLGSSPTLRHCRDMPAVQARLAARRAAIPRQRVPHSAVLMLLIAGLTLVSAWFVATGAVAFAGMITR